MQSTSAFYCDMGHVFSITRNLTLEPARVQDCPHQDEHVVYDDGTSCDNVFGPFTDEDVARLILMKRLKLHSFTKIWPDGTVITSTFQVHVLEDHHTVMTETSVMDGVVIHTQIRQYANDTDWLRDLNMEAEFRLSRGDLAL